MYRASGKHKNAHGADLARVPCWVKELTDEAAYMELVLCNTQSELHALEEGKHAAESGMDLKAYAEAAGVKYDTLAKKKQAWTVYAAVGNVSNALPDDWVRYAIIHAAPEWLWPALVAKMLESGWTVAQTRERVAAFKGIEMPRAAFDRQAIATHLINGAMKPAEIGQMGAAFDSAKVRDDDGDHLWTAMHQEKARQGGPWRA